MGFFTKNPHFTNEVKPGQRVLLDDRNVHLQCIEQGGQEEDQPLICKVVHGGLITSNKGINLPDTDLSVPALTSRDYQCADFAVEKGFDCLALSFVRCADDVRQLKEHLREHYAKEANIGTVTSNKFIPVISKIEKPPAMGASRQSSWRQMESWLPVEILEWKWT